MFENQNNNKQTTIPLNPSIFYPDFCPVSDSDRKWAQEQLNSVANLQSGL